MTAGFRSCLKYCVAALMLLFLFSGVSLGQPGEDVRQFSRLPAGQNLDSLNFPANIVWADLFFDLDHDPANASGFIEGYGSPGNKVSECLGAGGHCLTIRIAFGIEDIRDGFGIPEDVKAHIPVGWLEIDRYGGDFNETLGIPIDIELQYTNRRKSFIVSDNHKRQERFKHIQGVTMGEISTSDTALKLWRQIGEFRFNTFDKLLQRHVLRQTILQFLYPCTVDVVANFRDNTIVSIGAMNASLAGGKEGKSVLHDKDFFYITPAGRLVRSLRRFFTVGENYKSVLNLQNGDCCRMSAATEIEREGDNNNEACVEMSW